MAAAYLFTRQVSSDGDEKEGTCKVQSTFSAFSLNSEFECTFTIRQDILYRFQSEYDEDGELRQINYELEWDIAYFYEYS